MSEVQASVTEYLRKPYARIVTPEEDGTFRAEILEFPGCLATAETAAEALVALERVAESWLQIALSKGQRIPEPVDTIEYSGKLMLRLSRSLHKKAARIANREGVSLNHFIVSCVALQVGERSAIAQKVETNVNLFVSAMITAEGTQVISSSGIPRPPEGPWFVPSTGGGPLHARN